MSVLALLLILLLSMVNGATKLWRSNENRVDAYREARAAINLIASDLASIYPSTNLKYFYTQEDKAPTTPVTLTDMDGSLFFLTATPTSAQDPTGNKSDLCTVGYYLGYDQTTLASGKGTKSYNLYRYFRSSDETWTELSSATGDILSGVTIDTSPTATDSELLAKNITGFTVAPYTIDAPATPGGSYGSPTDFTKSATTPMPDMLEVTIKAISNEAAKRFDGNQSAWEDTKSITRQQDERTFTTRIYLPGAAQVKP